jgi:hypothetical protein
MPSVSGLSHSQRIRCRDRAVQAAKLGLANKANLHYTQGPQRWDGIKNHRNAQLGQCPTHADCSSFATWCLWNAMQLRFGLPDLVNGAGWTAGFTGTMLSRGKRVQHASNALRGDCVFYGTGHPGQHVTIVVGREQGVPMVISFGSEPGPFYLRFNYLSDVMQFRRYI